MIAQCRLRAGVPALILGAWLAGWLSPASLVAAPPPPYAKEHAITIDATALTPPTWWYVPGKTPLIWSVDPENTDAYRTTTARQLALKPGNYRFGTFTFDFPFVVTLDGLLEFSPTLDQCVDGRGTQVLKVRCSRTVPYGGKPDY